MCHKQFARIGGPKAARGASRRAVEVGEDRQLFKEAMHRIGLDVPRSAVVKSMDEARAAVRNTGIPAVIRPSSVSYTPLRAHETVLDLVCRLLLEKKKPHAQ